MDHDQMTNQEGNVNRNSGNWNGNIPDEYQPISMWGYFGYQILFSIPCLGLILLIVFSLGGTRNINLRNFARSYFCFTILVLILVGLLMMLGVTSQV